MALRVENLMPLMRPWVSQLQHGGVDIVMEDPEQVRMWEPLGGSVPAVLKAAAYGISMWSLEPKMYRPAIEVLRISISSLEGSSILRSVLDASLQTMQPGFGANEMMWVLLVLHAELSRKHLLHTITPDISPQNQIGLMDSGLIIPAESISKACSLQPQIPGGYISAVIVFKEAGKAAEAHRYAKKVRDNTLMLLRK
jgi:hypothetical protein